MSDLLRTRYKRAADGLSGAAEQAADQVYAAWVAGRVNDREFEAFLTQALMHGVDTGRRAADIVAVGALGYAPAALGVSVVDVAALAKAAATMTALLDEPDLTLRVRRLVKGETLYALQQGVVDNYRANGVDGYTRGLSATACELCVWLNKSDYVYPAGQPMHQHPGCTCVPIPTTKENAA